MQIKDTGLGFGIVTIVAHWVGVILMLGFLWAATAYLLIPESIAFTTARNLAALCLVLYAFRLYWRLRHHHPLPLGPSSPVVVLVSRGITIGMLLAGIILPLIFIWAVEVRDDQELFAGAVTPSHYEGAAFYLTVLFFLGVGAFTLGLLLHLFGALKHVLQKDGSLSRMFGKNIEL